MWRFGLEYRLTTATRRRELGEQEDFQIIPWVENDHCRDTWTHLLKLQVQVLSVPSALVLWTAVHMGKYSGKSCACLHKSLSVNTEASVGCACLQKYEVGLFTQTPGVSLLQAEVWHYTQTRVFIYTGMLSAYLHIVVDPICPILILTCSLCWRALDFPTVWYQNYVILSITSLESDLSYCLGRVCFTDNLSWKPFILTIICLEKCIRIFFLLVGDCYSAARLTRSVGWTL